VAKERKSGYVASGPSTPAAGRIHRAGRLDEVLNRLREVKVTVVRGGALLDSDALWYDVQDRRTSTGHLHARNALRGALDGFPDLVVWDAAKGRTKAERLALVDRVLAELGGKRRHGGGWSVRQ